MQGQQPTVEDSFQKPLNAGKKPSSHARQRNSIHWPILSSSEVPDQSEL